MSTPLDVSSLNRFCGAFTAIVTSFSADGSRLDFDRLEQQIAFQKQGGITGIVIAGTTGESPTLEEREYRELVERGIALAHEHGLLAIVGTGSNSTSHAVHLQRAAAKSGADAALCVNPYYNKPTQDGLIRHFLAMADAAPLPIMLYNIPGRTGVALTPETIARLAQHPHIRFIKDATGALDAANETLLHAPTLSVFSGDDPLTYPMMALGAKGVVSVLSNLVPARVQALCSAMLENRHAEGLRIHRELWSLTKALFAETNPIPVKAAMSLLGRDSGALRLPMSPASGATVDRLRVELRRHELIPA